MNTEFHPAFNRNFVNIHIEPVRKCANSAGETRIMLTPADNHRIQENHKKITEKASSFNSLPFAIAMTAISTVETPIIII